MFPLGVGMAKNGRQRLAEEREISRKVNQAEKYTNAYKARENLKKVKSKMENALNAVKGTGKTVKQVRKENIKKETEKILSASHTKWSSEKISGPYGDYMERKAGPYAIHSSDGHHTIMKNGKWIAVVDRLKEAKAFVESQLEKEIKNEMD